jgi:tripartite-type tricarboxylate transporter receptor subunit TctC
MNDIVRALALALVLVSPLAGSAVFAQTNWPEKPVRLVVGFTAGSATDVTARMFAQKFSEAWGQPVIVDNVAGNSGAIGTDKVAKAAPDGYTLMWSGNAAITILPSLQPLPFDPLKDLAPISTSLSMPSIFMVNNDLPVKSIADLIAYAKANPGTLSYGTPGVGTPQHVAGELFAHLAGIKMEQIPYRGANLADVMSGVVPVGIQNAGASLPLVRDGRVRGIGITSLKRSPNAPDLPTLAESGFPGFEATSWFALLAPAGTPQPIIDKVRAESLKVLADPEMQKKFATLGLDIIGSTPEETRAAIANDIPKWAQVIKDANIKPGN